MLGSGSPAGLPTLRSLTRHNAYRLVRLMTDAHLFRVHAGRKRWVQSSFALARNHNPHARAGGRGTPQKAPHPAETLATKGRSRRGAVPDGEGSALSHDHPRKAVRRTGRVPRQQPVPGWAANRAEEPSAWNGWAAAVPGLRQSGLTLCQQRSRRTPRRGGGEAWGRDG